VSDVAEVSTKPSPPATPVVTPVLAEMKAAASAAKLRYVSDDKPGITRVRTSHGFGYRYPDGSKVLDEETLTRIRKLAIPPAYEQVWICPAPNGHLQAVGRDARGRNRRHGLARVASRCAVRPRAESGPSRTRDR
jgi:DNA topoisomerase IB